MRAGNIASEITHSFRPEHWCFGWCRLGSQALTLVEDCQTPIESLLNFDTGMGIAQSAVAWCNLQSVLTKTHHVISTYGTLILEAKYMLGLKVLPRLTVG